MKTNKTNTLSVLTVLLLAFLSFSAYAGDPPAGRIDYAIAYFPPANAIIMHGGWGPASGWDPLNEVWKLDANGWSQMPAAGSPAMAHHSMTYDSARQVLVVCGKKDLTNWQDSTYETWEFDGSAWTKKADIPTAAAGGDVEIAYDPSRQLTVLYATGFDPGTSETLEYSGAANSWVKKSPAQQPTATADGALMKFDETTGKVTLIVGAENFVQHTETDETWLWDGVNWTQVAGAQPQKALRGGMVFDGSRGEMVLLTTAMETWIFNGTAWTKRTPASSPAPSGNAFFSLAYHPGWHMSLFYGGEARIQNAFTYPEKTWQWNGVIWTEWAPPAVPGDLNGDGQVGLADAILALRVMVSIPLPAGTAANPAAEVSGGGRIGPSDAIYILQQAAGLRSGG
jgi:hypothetical protein